MLPGEFVQTIDAAATYDPSVATDQLFMVGLTEKGSATTPKRSFSLTQWAKTWGGPIQNSPLYYTARALFNEGLRALVTLRAVGPNPVRASSTAKNNSSTPVIKIEALDDGAYGNSITRQFVAGKGGGAVQLILTLGSTVLHSPDLANQAAIVAWGNGTGIVAVSALEGSGLPVADGSAVGLTGGTDDHASITMTQYGAALNLLDVRMGPGQVCLPGLTTEEAHDLLREHHLVYDRIALLDVADSSSAATLVSGVAPQRAKEGSIGIAAFAPWVIDPDGNELPPVALAAAKMAQVDLQTGNPNEPAAGTNGQADYLVGLTQDFSAASRETLDEGAVNAIYDVNGQGQIQVYDYDTLANPETDPLSTALSNARLDMFIRSEGRKLGRSLNFKEIDAKGHLASQYNGLLTGRLKELQDQGVIYGFKVDTGSVNNAETATEKKLNARIGIERSEYAKEVFLDITNYAIGANV